MNTCAFLSIFKHFEQALIVCLIDVSLKIQAFPTSPAYKSFHCRLAEDSAYTEIITLHKLILTHYALC